MGNEPTMQNGPLEDVLKQVKPSYWRAATSTTVQCLMQIGIALVASSERVLNNLSDAICKAIVKAPLLRGISLDRIAYLSARAQSTNQEILASMNRFSTQTCYFNSGDMLSSLT